MSCHRTPGNNLHLNITQYLTGASPSDRKQIENLFHRLKGQSKQVEYEWGEDQIPAMPRQDEVIAHLQRVCFQVKHDPAIPDGRRPRLLEYCQSALDDAGNGVLPDKDTWFAWTNLVTAFSQARERHTANSTAADAGGVANSLEGEGTSDLYSGFTQAQIRSSHNSYHVWRALCFADPRMTEIRPDRDELWARLEEAAFRADRKAGISAARVRERAAKRRAIRNAVDPSYVERPVPS